MSEVTIRQCLIRSIQSFHRKGPLNVKMKKFINYLKECHVELVHKTTWPAWQKLQSSALLVIVCTVILAIGLAVIDFVFQRLMTFIYTL
jgi:preprotein translocase subunit SecE